MNKRGLSGVIVAVLLVLVAIAAVSILWAPISKFIINVQEVDPAAKCAATSLKIDSANVDTSVSPNLLKVFVGRISGKDELTGISVYLEMEDGSIKKIPGITCNNDYPLIGEVNICSVTLAQAGGNFSKVRKVKINAEFGNVENPTICPNQVEYPVVIR